MLCCSTTARAERLMMPRWKTSLMQQALLTLQTPRQSTSCQFRMAKPAKISHPSDKLHDTCMLSQISADAVWLSEWNSIGFTQELMNLLMTLVIYLEVLTLYAVKTVG